MWDGEWERKTGKGRRLEGREAAKVQAGAISAQGVTSWRRTDLRARAASVSSPVLGVGCPVALLGIPVSQGLDRWDPVQENLFPTRYGSPLQMIANISTAGALHRTVPQSLADIT